MSGNRSRRLANEARRAKKRAQCEPLPIAEQHFRRDDRAISYAKAYPTAPKPAQDRKPHVGPKDGKYGSGAGGSKRAAFWRRLHPRDRMIAV
jgi:hypothetical protein